MSTVRAAMDENGLREQTCAVCDEMIGTDDFELEAHGADDKTRDPSPGTRGVSPPAP